MTQAKPAFLFSDQSLQAIEDVKKCYPAEHAQSALLPTLWIAQRQNGGWLSDAALHSVADALKLPYMRVFEVASFYTLFRLTPRGKNLVQICRTTSCYLRGSNQLTQTCLERLKINPGESTQDGLFSLEEVECLGACANAPVVRINDDYYEDLTPQNLQAILEQLAQHATPKTGSQIGRICSKAHLKQTQKS